MKRNEWLLADKNIQYRIMNAIIKERISPEGMKITKDDNVVEIQYQAIVDSYRMA